jgi:hypothetical protein
VCPDNKVVVAVTIDIAETRNRPTKVRISWVAENADAHSNGGVGFDVHADSSVRAAVVGLSVWGTDQHIGVSVMIDISGCTHG